MKKLLVIVAAVIVALFIFKDMAVKSVVVGGIKAAAGLDVSLKKIGIGILKPSVHIEEMKILNPPGFGDDKVMMDAPEIYLSFNPVALTRHTIHLGEVRLNVADIVIVKNAKGAINFNSLRTVKEAEGKGAADGKKEEANGEPYKLQIDKLRVKVGRVVYKDYSKGAVPAVSEYKINIDQTFENISDAKSLVSAIFMKALMGTPLANLGDLDLGALQVNMGNALKNATQAAPKTAQEASKAAGEAVKDITKMFGGQ